MSSKADSRWLVVGANGMLGSEVMAQLAGRDATGIDLPDIDITDPDSVREKLRNVDVVVNCAAWTAVDDAESSEAKAFTVNAVGPALLAARCSEIGAKLVQISTDYVFDGSRPGAYPEDFVPNPQSAYGRTKAAGEWAVRTELPEDSWILRTAWLYGAGGPNFVKTMVKLESSKPELQVVNDQHGQPTWARDLARQIVAVVDNDIPAGVYHATSAGETTWFGLTQRIFELAGADPQRVAPTTTDKFPRPAPRPANSVLAHDKWADVGLSPLPNWEESLEAAWESGAFTDLN
ncbi:MAG: dTDP-4-dehydrorhamnose reductase [Actinobacteria bacterium]|nr:dTDP-4-dehydrorhamnose reductase [Actinomycetota bacterium]